MKYKSLIRTGVFIVILSLLAVFQSQAATYFVWTNSPSDGPGTSWDSAYHTIQGAVDAARDGDTVLVTNGVYNQGSNNFDGVNNRVAITQEISVIGVCGAENTFIVGELKPDSASYMTAMRCVYMTSNAFLSGFTLTNGAAYAYMKGGGGVQIDYEGTVSNCIIVGNVCGTGGGASLWYGGVISDCWIYSNRASSGGGIWMYYGGEVQNCVISNNSASFGGGVRLIYDGTIRDSIIINNKALEYSQNSGGEGGGVHLYEGGILTNCVVQGNVGNGDSFNGGGGGVYLLGSGLITGCDLLQNSSPNQGSCLYVIEGGIVDNCRIYQNITTSTNRVSADTVFLAGAILKNSAVFDNMTVYGVGGAYCSRSRSVLTGLVSNCVFVNNYSQNSPGGLILGFGGIASDCLIINNRTGGYGGGLALLYGGYANNCTVVGNSSSQKAGGVLMWKADGIIMNSIIYDNTAPTGNNYFIEGTGSFSYSCTTPDPVYLGGTGNITNSPLFIDASDGNYRLRYDSPCRDSGTNMAAMFGAKDLDGKPRIVNRTVDMGAYEFHAFSVFNDYDRNGKSDLTLYDTNSGNWYIRGVSGEVLAWEQQWGGNGFQQVAGDYDGDSFADLTVVSDAERQWYALSMTGSNLIWGQQWGWDKSLSVRGDYDGDGKNDLGIFGDGRWYVFSATNSVISWAKQWGWSGAIPVSGDYDGDGRDDYAVFDGKLGNWYILSASNTVLAWAFQWGWEGVIPVSGEFDGDGKSDLAVYDDVRGNWFVVTLDLKVLAWYTQWGYEKTIPVSGDYDGDGKSDLGVYDSSLGKWHIRSVNGKVIAWDDNWGAKGLVPVR